MYSQILYRPRPETSAASSSKACREKLRRDKLNERYRIVNYYFSLQYLFTYTPSIMISRFLELAAVLEPGKPPKTDKVALLSDAIRMLTDLQSETQKLKESKEDLKAKIKELKVRLVPNPIGPPALDSTLLICLSST